MGILSEKQKGSLKKYEEEEQEKHDEKLRQTDEILLKGLTKECFNEILSKNISQKFLNGKLKNNVEYVDMYFDSVKLAKAVGDKFGKELQEFCSDKKEREEKAYWIVFPLFEKEQGSLFGQEKSFPIMRVSRNLIDALEKKQQLSEIKIKNSF